MNFMLLLFIFVIAAFLGKELISKVPSILHTPLMSATNAIHGIAFIAAIIGCAASPVGSTEMILCFFAIILGTINAVGGYAVTDRMLGMFRQKEDKK